MAEDRYILLRAIADGGTGNPEDYAITPRAWKLFVEWYGDKAYRHIDFADDWYRAVYADALLRIEGAS